ncbi:hypothetical protein HY949_05235 [Candidatus Gottesmanbacteria bacterium]|nr:hypothetical protein [Candidatus Gottesmanbacteria bacterium]
MEFIAEKLNVIRNGTTQLDSRVRTGLVLANGIAANLLIAATTQPAEVALGGMTLISAATIFEGLHQMGNLDTRDDLAHPERG